MLNWREVWVMALGYDPPISYLPPIVSTVLIYLLVMVFCYSFYQLSKVFLPGFLQEYAQDFFKTLAFCTYCFGHGVVRNSYGHLAYCFLVVPLNTTTVFLFSLGDGNPVSVWSKYLRGQIPEWKFLVKVSVQILAGFSAWELGYIIFSLDFYDSFAGSFEFKTLEHCRSDLRIPALAGFLLEATGVTYDYWMNQQTLSKFRPLDVLLKFTNTAFIVCCGVRMTGMYMHPAMATGRGLGCGSTPIPYHLLVYWAGPFTGVFLGLKISKVFSLSSLISTSQKLESETKSTNHRPTQKKASNHKGANGTSVRQRNRKKTYYSNGVRMTGMYMHPAMATGRGLGCGRSPIPYHLLVYWAGPFTGVFLELKISKVFSLSSLISTSQNLESETKSTNHRPTQKKASNHKGANGTSVRQRNRKKTYYSNGRKG